MDNERETNGGRGLGRWAAIAVLIVAGVVLFFAYGAETRSAIEPSTVEAQ